MAKFAEYEVPDVQHEGYVVALPAAEGPEPEFIMKRIAEGKLVKQPTKGGVAMHWVCTKCFEEFKDVMGWHIKPG